MFPKGPEGEPIFVCQRFVDYVLPEYPESNVNISVIPRRPKSSTTLRR